MISSEDLCEKKEKAKPMSTKNGRKQG